MTANDKTSANDESVTTEPVQIERRDGEAVAKCGPVAVPGPVAKIQTNTGDADVKVTGREVTGGGTAPHVEVTTTSAAGDTALSLYVSPVQAAEIAARLAAAAQTATGNDDRAKDTYAQTISKTIDKW